VLGAIVALAPELVEGHSTAEAAASLSGLVNLAASQQHLKVLRLDPLPDSAAGVFSEVGVHAELEGDVTGLAGLIRAIETGEPLLSVRALTATVSDPVPHGSAPEVMHIELDVSGYFLPRGTSP
jgi:hypothetical protein